jgi:phosphatidylserine synthase
VLVAGGVTVLLLLSFGGFVAEVRESGFWAGMAVVWAGLTVALIFVALAARPSTAGRLMIFGWVVALLGYALSDWVYWTVHNDSQTWGGMAWLVLSSIALAISGGFIGPRSTSEPAQA